MVFSMLNTVNGNKEYAFFSVVEIRMAIDIDGENSLRMSGRHTLARDNRRTGCESLIQHGPIVFERVKPVSGAILQLYPGGPTM
jgi:hypothetical protein